MSEYRVSVLDTHIFFEIREMSSLKGHEKCGLRMVTNSSYTFSQIALFVGLPSRLPPPSAEAQTFMQTFWCSPLAGNKTDLNK
jgi:hypothetical protein